MSRKRIFVLLAFALILVLRFHLTAPPISAAGIVTNCGSQQGLADAMNSGSGLITFSCGSAPVTITITQAGGLNVVSGSSYTIDGGNLVTLNGANSVRLFTVQSGGALTLTNIILTNGYSGSAGGGAVYVNSGGTLVMDHATIQNSRTNGVAGGAIYSTGGDITLMNNSIVQGNSSYNYGAINSTGSITMVNSLIQNNSATTGGGALSVGGRVAISNTQIYSNTASGADGGGGIYITSSGNVAINNSQLTFNRAFGGGAIQTFGALTITNSIVAGNTSTFVAGGIVSRQGTVNLSNVTLNDNHASNPGGGILADGNAMTLTNVTLSNNSGNAGGGIDHTKGTLSLTNVTFSGNSAVNYGGGLNFVSSGAATLTNVTFSGNAASSGGNFAITFIGTATLKNTILSNPARGTNCFISGGGTLASAGFNLSSDNSCNLTQAGDWNSTPAYLGPLANNGGFTATHVPFPPSKAIDGGSACPVLDQRGIGRVGLACDIGAVEYVPGMPTPFLWLPLILR